MIRTSAAVENHVRALGALLRSRGLSVTHQRIAVYRSLLEDPAHPDAERILGRVRRRTPTISLGTVYKALQTLEDLGAITQVDSPGSAARYEATIEPHHHLVCDDCGRIVDVREPTFSKLRLPARAAGGFKITGCTVKFRGLCRDCRLRSKKRLSSGRR